MKKLIITVLMMGFLSQGAFGSNNELNRRLIKNLEQQVEALKERNQELKKSVLARLSARERAYVLRRALTGAEITINIASLDGVTVKITIASTANVRELKQHISELRDIHIANINLFKAGVEDKLANSSTISDLGTTVVFMLIRNIHEVEKQALEALYNSTNGADWVRKDGWNTDIPLSEWEGVTVDEEGRVVRLDLTGNQLSGPITAALGQLTALTKLDLRYNNLRGTIPAELGQLGALRGLYLDNNQLEGPIPVELGQLGALTYLYLYNNQLTGTIPRELMEFEKNIRPGNQLD